MRRASKPIGEDLEWARDIVNRACRADIGSSDNEIRFLMDMEHAFSSYGARTYVSEPQRSWLQSIAKRLEEAEADEETGGMTPVDEVLR